MEVRRLAGPDHTWTALHKEWSQFLRQFHWDVFFSPSWRFSVSHQQALRDVVEFLKLLGDQAYAVVGLEGGHDYRHVHAHCLVGGLANEIARSHASALWKRGDLGEKEKGWSRYDHNRGAAEYVTKLLTFGPDMAERVVFPVGGEPLKRTRRNRTHRKITIS